MSGRGDSANESRRQERDLVRRMLSGDEAAFEIFCDDYVPVMYRFVGRRLAGDRELIAEIVQTTLCRVIAKLATFRGESALATWLCACCANEIAAHFRRRKRLPPEVELKGDEVPAAAAPAVATPDGPERSLLRRERAWLVHEALDALPPHYGKALEWKYLEGLSVREIASRLDLGAKAAESVLTRARESFRRAYARLTADTGGSPPAASRYRRMAVEP